MTNGIKKKPCFVNSDIGEISSDFEIVRCSRASRRTFNHSHPSPLYFIELCPMQPTQHGDFGYNQLRGRIRNCEQWSHAHFCRQNVGSTHHLPRIYFRREFVALGPIPLASLFRPCILFSFSSLFTYFCISPPRKLLQCTKEKLRLEFLSPLRKDLNEVSCPPL